MNIILAKQTDGKVNVYAPRFSPTVMIPPQFASEVAAFVWLLAQNGARRMDTPRNWRSDEEDNISGEYDVNFR